MRDQVARTAPRNFSTIDKMRSSTSSEGSRLVGIVVPCPQTRVAIETSSRANGANCRAFQEACHQHKGCEKY